MNYKLKQTSIPEITSLIHFYNLKPIFTLLPYLVFPMKNDFHILAKSDLYSIKCLD